MTDTPPPGLDFSMAGQPMPSLQIQCPHCHEWFNRSVSLSDLMEQNSTDHGEEAWSIELDDRNEAEITARWEVTSYEVITDAGR